MTHFPLRLISNKLPIYNIIRWNIYLFFFFIELLTQYTVIRPTMSHSSCNWDSISSDPRRCQTPIGYNRIATYPNHIKPQGHGTVMCARKIVIPPCLFFEPNLLFWLSSISIFWTKITILNIEMWIYLSRFQ